jgi:hypothetical protein
MHSTKPPTNKLERIWNKATDRTPRAGKKNLRNNDSRDLVNSIYQPQKSMADIKAGILFRNIHSESSHRGWARTNVRDSDCSKNHTPRDTNKEYYMTGGTWRSSNGNAKSAPSFKLAWFLDKSCCNQSGSVIFVLG